jgi:hypothetical protein
VIIISKKTGGDIMKNLLIFAAVCILVFGVATVSFAETSSTGKIAGWEKNENISAQQDVHAVIEPYAEVQWGTVPYLEFEGSRKENCFASTTVTVNYNAPIHIDFSGTKLIQCTDNSSIDTYYYFKLLWFWIPVHATLSNPANWGWYSLRRKGQSTYEIGVSGKLGDIADQSAGSYKSTITMTVTSPFNKPLWHS